MGKLEIFNHKKAEISKKTNDKAERLRKCQECLVEKLSANQANQGRDYQRIIPKSNSCFYVTSVSLPISGSRRVWRANDETGTRWARWKSETKRKGKLQSNTQSWRFWHLWLPVLIVWLALGKSKYSECRKTSHVLQTDFHTLFWPSILRNFRNSLRKWYEWEKNYNRATSSNFVKRKSDV